MPKLVIYILIIAGLVGLGAGIGSHTQRKHDDLKYGAQIATLNGQYAARMKAISDAATQQANAALAAQQAMEARVAALDAQHTQEINHAKAVNARLRAAVAAGTTRLRIAGTCPAAGGQQLSTPSGAAGVGDGAGVELAASARQTYFDLRDALAADTAKIAALQDYIAKVCLQSR